jgi:hypothetical protein
VSEWVSGWVSECSYVRVCVGAVYFLGISVFVTRYTRVQYLKCDSGTSNILVCMSCHNCSIICIGAGRTSSYVPKNRQM